MRLYTNDFARSCAHIEELNMCRAVMIPPALMCCRTCTPEHSVSEVYHHECFMKELYPPEANCSVPADQLYVPWVEDTDPQRRASSGPSRCNGTKRARGTRGEGEGGGRCIRKGVDWGGKSSACGYAPLNKIVAN